MKFKSIQLKCRIRTFALENQFDGRNFRFGAFEPKFIFGISQQNYIAALGSELHGLRNGQAFDVRPINIGYNSNLLSVGRTGFGWLAVLLQCGALGVYFSGMKNRIR